MLIIHSLKTIYVRVPKTASTSFINALDELKPEHYGDVHQNACCIPRLLEKRPELKRYAVIGFIRHPYQWVRSAYGHWTRNPINKRMFHVKPPQTMKGFARMVRHGPAGWLKNEAGEVICDVKRTEDMAEIMAGYGLELHYKAVAWTEPHEPDDELKQICQQRFHQEFLLGKYEV